MIIIGAQIRSSLKPLGAISLWCTKAAPPLMLGGAVPSDAWSYRYSWHVFDIAYNIYIYTSVHIPTYRDWTIHTNWPPEAYGSLGYVFSLFTFWAYCPCANSPASVYIYIYYERGSFFFYINFLSACIIFIGGYIFMGLCWNSFASEICHFLCIEVRLYIYYKWL